MKWEILQLGLCTVNSYFVSISIHVIQSELNYNITVRTIDKMKKIQKNVSVKILVLCYVDKNIG